MYSPYLRIRTFFVLLAAVVGLFAQNGWATPIITSVVETGGDNEPTDTITARYSGQTFPVSVPNEPVLGAVIGATYTVGRFAANAPVMVDANHRYYPPSATVGVPSYLVDGEYIMAGNDNRDNAAYTLDVTVSRDVRVYMLIDNRLGDASRETPPTFNATHMQWILDEGWTAVRTGNNHLRNSAAPDEVGMDEGADGTLNQYYGVYAKNFPAGTFRLRQADNAGQHMYGVVIQPPPLPHLSVGLSFATDQPNAAGSALASTAIAGAIPQAHWNNLGLNSGSSASVVADAAGSATATTIAVQWTSPNTWASTGRGEENLGFAAGTPDRTLMTGYLDTTETAAGVATVTVSGIPAAFTSARYDVLVYCVGGVSGRGGAYSIGSETRYGTAPANPAVHVEDAGTGLTDTGTYVRFRDQRGSSFTLVASANTALGARVNYRAPMNAIQIVRNPNPDVIQPTVLGVDGKTDLTKLVVRFSELMDPGTAQDYFNYAVGGGPEVREARLGADGMTVTLTFASELLLDTLYQVTIQNVQDLAGLKVDPVSIPVRTFAKSRGFTLKELYLNIGAGLTVADLTGNPKYPGSPDIVRYGGLAELNTADEFDNYGARLSGWLTPPVSGSYNFFMSSDDGGALYLSTDSNPANRVLIASEPAWNDRRDWLSTVRRNAVAPENRSSSLFPGGIDLVAGQPYYFEALVKEGSGIDALGFAWQLPGAPEPTNGTAPVSGIYLSSLVNPAGAGIQITQQPTDQTNLKLPGVPPSPTTFSVAISATGPNAGTLFYQWMRNDGSGWRIVPGANSASYVFTPTLADNGARFRVEAFVPGAEVVSETATLTVAQPNTAPRFTAGADQTVSEDSGAQSVQWATGIVPHSLSVTPVAYANDFSSGLAGMQVAGIAAVADGVLRLTTPTNDSYGAASIATPGVQTYERLTVSWKSYVGGGAGGGADGYSLNIAEGLPVDPGYGGEEGLGSGLTVTVDTWDNGTGADVGLDIRWRGALVAYASIPKDNDGTGNYLRKGAFVNAKLELSAAGVATLEYDGNTISAALPNYAGLRANRVLFWSRTGGANDNHWVDDFSFQGFPPDDSAAENGQTVHFEVSNNNPSLFSAQPAINAQGVLTYTPAPNANGTATVTVVAKDDGGTAFGGNDTSAPATFLINVGRINDCPTVAGQAIELNSDSSISLQLSGSDMDGDALTYVVTLVPQHGIVSVNTNTGAANYTPAAGYVGPDSFAFEARDALCAASPATITITVHQAPRCPTAVAKIEPNVLLEPGQTETVVIAGNNTNACLILDGTGSADADNDPLIYIWAVVSPDGTTVPIASGATATVCLDAGLYRVRLIVDDGQCSRTADVDVEIITPSEAVDVLIEKVSDSNIGKNKRPFIASLKAASASFDRSSCHSAHRQLNAFINKVQAQIATDDPALAAELIRLTNAILEQVDCPE